MSLIDSTYFTGEISIPLGTNNTLSESITRHEADILRQLLGYDLAKLVVAYANPGSDQRIIDIVEGKEYTVNGYTVKWNGLVNTEKVSLLAYYVYMQYTQEKSNPFTNVGFIAPSVEGGGAVSGAFVIQGISNKLRELAGYACQDALAPSLYNFLINHQSDYPEWVFNEYGLLNAFDL